MFTEYDVARNSDVLHYNISIPRATSYSVNSQATFFTTNGMIMIKNCYLWLYLWFVFFQWKQMDKQQTVPVLLLTVQLMQRVLPPCATVIGWKDDGTGICTGKKK